MKRYTYVVVAFHFFVRDHQGSVTAVIGDGSAEQRTRYYPFGGLMTQDCTGEGVSADKYTGKRLDRMHGLDWYDFGARQYDPVYGRFASIDPLCEKYPNLSPYAYCGNDPVNAIDVDGDSIVVITSHCNKYLYEYVSNSNFELTENTKSNITSADSDMAIFSQAIDNLRSTPEGDKLVKELAEHEKTVTIFMIHRNNIFSNKEDSYDDLGKIGSGIIWNPESPSIENGTPYVSLAHEMVHARDRLNGTMNEEVWKYVETDMGLVPVLKCEKKAMEIENIIRKSMD